MTLPIASILIAWALPVGASVNVNCNVTVNLDQQVGSERLECPKTDKGALQEVRVIRKVKTLGQAGAQASARYSDSCSTHCSCSCSCGQCSSQSCSCSRSCSTSGSGSDSCSDSKTAETTFVVAKASTESLAKKGFAVRSETGPNLCELLAPDGSSLDPLRATGVVLWIYGEELMRETGGDSADSQAPSETQPKPTVDTQSLKKDISFD